jgi:hypothetical protein
MFTQPVLFQEASGDGSGSTTTGGGGSGTTTTPTTLLDSGGQPQPPSHSSHTAGSYVVDGAFTKGFTAHLPEDLKPYQGTLSKFDGLPVADVLKSYAHLEKRLGEGVKMPAPDAAPEQVAAWRKITGTPESPEGYKLERPADIPEEAWSPELVKGFTELAHKHHLAPAAVKEISDWWNGQQKAAAEQFGQQYLQQQEQVVGELRKEWGEKFGQNVAAARRVAAVAGVDPNDPELGNSPKVIRALFAMSNLISDDQEVRGGKSGPNLSPAQEADAIQTDQGNPWHADYMGRNGKDRQAAAADRVRKLRMAGGRP